MMIAVDNEEHSTRNGRSEWIVGKQEVMRPDYQQVPPRMLPIMPDNAAQPRPGILADIGREICQAIAAGDRRRRAQVTVGDFTASDYAFFGANSAGGLLNALPGCIMMNMKAYVFGAGASVDAGYPLASQLLHGLSNWLNHCASSTHWVPWALNRIVQVQETFGGNSR
jgi:hypothetical protein